MKKMLYKAGGRQKIHGKRLLTKIVESDEALQASIDDGWSETTDVEAQVKESEVNHVTKALGLVASGFGLVAADSATDNEVARMIIVEVESNNNDADSNPEDLDKSLSKKNEPTERELLEEKADSLGVKYRSDISDEKLAERIEEAEKAAQENELD